MGNAACSSQNKNQRFNPVCLPYKILVTAYIWNDNSHNLFDYESESLCKKDLAIDFQGKHPQFPLINLAKIVQIEKDILALTKTEYVKHQKELIELKCEQKQFSILQKENSIWRVIRPKGVTDLPTIERYQLTVGQIIKLGRVKLILKDYSFHNEDEFKVADELQSQESQSIDSNLPDSDIVCRICLSKMSTVDNPYICPCKCIGSMKYIHLKCLQNWINSFLKIKQYNGIYLYYWKSLKCELCKHTYKIEFRFQDYVYKLLDIPRPKEPFVMFQINHCDKNKDQGYYVVELRDKITIKIGRTQECDIKLHDISVSRHHATIFINREKNSLSIEDNCSKFGTLILANPSELVMPVLIKDQMKLAIQAGRIVVVIGVDKKQKNFQKYHVAPQYEVFRQIKQQDDEEKSSLVGEKDVDIDDILINDPNFKKEQDIMGIKYANYLSGSICQPNQNL